MKKDTHYRLPLKLISSYTWATLSKPARAILPVIGVYREPESGKAWPGVKLIAELAGYKDERYRYIRAGMDNLIEKNLIIREKEGRHYFYYLTSLALREGRESYFPIYKEAMIISRKWAGLTSSEKSLYPVVGNKAKINEPEVLGSEYHAMGNINIYKIKEYAKWAGISRWSFYTAYYGLNHKGLIEFSENDAPFIYWVYVPK